MSKQSRRQFIANAGKAAVITSLAVMPAAVRAASTEKRLFIHHVYFWLDKTESKDDHAALQAGLQALSKVPSIQQFHIGVPATTNRDVIETTYQFSWLAIFPTKEAQDEYQVDPIHLKFVEECSYLWNKVVVHDSVDV